MIIFKDYMNYCYDILFFIDLGKYFEFRGVDKREVIKVEENGG